MVKGHGKRKNDCYFPPDRVLGLLQLLCRNQVGVQRIDVDFLGFGSRFVFRHGILLFFPGFPNGTDRNIRFIIPSLNKITEEVYYSFIFLSRLFHIFFIKLLGATIGTADGK